MNDIEPTWDSIPMSARRQFTSALEAEVEQTLVNLRPGGLAGAFKWAWKPALKRWLVERATRAIQGAR